jgi:hypothetical protein
MSLIKLSLDGNNLIIPVQGEFDSDILAGDGKIINLFYSVYFTPGGALPSIPFSFSFATIH